MNTINFKNIHGVILLGIGLLVQANRLVLNGRPRTICKFPNLPV